MGTLTEGRGNREDNAGVEIFPFLVLVIFWSCVYTTHKISHGRVVVALERRGQERLGEIKENNKHVRRIWTSAVTRALAPRPRPVSPMPGFSHIKQNQHLSRESERGC